MRAARRSRLLREVNDRIYELLAPVGPDLPGEFHCECGRDCGRRVILSSIAFTALRREGEVVLSADCSEPSLEQRARAADRAAGVPVPASVR